MAQDKIMPKDIARGYRNPLTAAVQIVAKDGLFPLMRGAGPIMGEHFVGTSVIFFSTDFMIDKLWPLRNYGYQFPNAGLPESWIKIMGLSSGIMFALFASYPVRTLRAMVEHHPLNNKGERLFETYAEAYWKFAGEQFNPMHCWTGFSRYFVKTAPPIFAAWWLADSFGLIRLREMQLLYVD
jgi:hypothetical protein